MKLGFAAIAARVRQGGRGRQQFLPFLRRTRRLDRIFRGSIIGMTILALAAIWTAWPSGRAALVGHALRAKWATLRDWP